MRYMMFVATDPEAEPFVAEEDDIGDWAPTSTRVACTCSASGSVRCRTRRWCACAAASSS